MNVENNAVSSSLLAAMNPAQQAASSSASDIQDRFMTLLVTQMKNQDPLNPMDNAQVTSQMAQLSTVTGVNKMNTTLESLIGSFQSNQSVQAAGMIGHVVVTPGSGLSLSEGKAYFGAEFAESVDSIQVAIKNAAGVTVRKMDMGAQVAGPSMLQWDGLNDKGAKAEDGNYTFEITAMKAGKAAELTPLAFGSVNSVSTGTQGVKLNVTGVGAINLADIRQIL